MEPSLVISVVSLGLVLLNSLYANFSNSPRAENEKIKQKIESLEKEFTEFRVSISDNHHKKPEVQSLLNPINDALRELKQDMKTHAEIANKNHESLRDAISALRNELLSIRHDRTALRTA